MSGSMRSHLTIEDSRPTHEDPKEAHRIVSGLLADMDDLVGIFVIGGGISGVLQALREAPENEAAHGSAGLPRHRP